MTGPRDVRAIATAANAIKGADRTSPISARTISKSRGIPALTASAAEWPGRKAAGVFLVNVGVMNSNRVLVLWNLRPGTDPIFLLLTPEIPEA